MKRELQTFIDNIPAVAKAANLEETFWLNDKKIPQGEKTITQVHPEPVSYTHLDIATLIFSKINVDTFFVTTCGISVERGITYPRMDEIIVQNLSLIHIS